MKRSQKMPLKTAAAMEFGAIAFLLLALVFADCMGTSSGLAGSFVREFAATTRDPSTQWMIILCLTCYFGAFSLIKSRSGSSDIWLYLFIALALLHYSIAYRIASGSMQVSVLLASIAVSKVVSTWASRRGGSKEQRAAWLIALLICSFACTGLIQVETPAEFQYDTISRWNGVWDNPNLYGLLMATGLVLAAGVVTRELRIERRTWWRILVQAFLLVAMVIMGRALFHSYSRGAWLGAAYGLGYLVLMLKATSHNQLRKPPIVFFASMISWSKQCGLSVRVILFSLAVLSLCQFQQTEWYPARRALTILNQNDFSWRNRMSAWEGALQITVEQPWLGAGWNRPEPLYEHYYLPPRLNDGGAIELNDYLMLGATLGIPALFFFGMYLWRSVGQNGETDWLAVTCRAGAIVLAVGFWFDGGLFKMPTAITFWILLEMGRESLKPGT